MILKEKAKARKYLKETCPKGALGCGVEEGMQGMVEGCSLCLVCLPALATDNG